MRTDEAAGVRGTIPLDHDSALGVSVIIPVWNAARTLPDAIASLQGQTWPHWEAILVDDGSTDDSRQVAESLARKDARLRVQAQNHAGPSVARNTGFALAQYPWLLLLDADDWIAPEYLAEMLNAISERPQLQAVCCDFSGIADDGKVVTTSHPSQLTDRFFEELAQSCVLAVHACVFHRRLLENTGGFDPSLATCEDWDFWQRISRTGPILGAVNRVLAFYRFRSDSLAVKGGQLLKDGLRVIATGHEADPRVKHPAAAFREGRSARELPAAALSFAGYCAGLHLAAGQPAAPVLDELSLAGELSLTPARLARAVAAGFWRATGSRPSDRAKLWTAASLERARFLTALAESAFLPRLSHRLERALNEIILRDSHLEGPIATGSVYAVPLDLEEPISVLEPPPEAEICQLHLRYGGSQIGTLELPVTARMPGYVLADAIAEQFAWTVMGRFLSKIFREQIRKESGADGVSLWRGDVCLARGLEEGSATSEAEVHDAIGWTVFLQELWGEPQLDGDAFYASPLPTHAPETEPGLGKTEEQPPQVEVSEALTPLTAPVQSIAVEVAVGGMAIGVVDVPIQDGRADVAAERTAITTQTGYELCRAAVREGLIGSPLNDPRSLRERLANAAQARRSAGLTEPRSRRAANIVAGELNRTFDSSVGFVLAGRVSPRMFGSSASRRAILPPNTAPAFSENKQGRLLLHVGGEAGGFVVCAPELIGPETMPPARLAPNQALPPKVEAGNPFEVLFFTRADPWGYTSSYEQTKYEQTLSMIPRGKVRRALEIGCAEGHFTGQLAPRIKRLLAVDVSETALQRASARCAGLRNVEFRTLNLATDPIEGDQDLIVCSEVLYYMRTEETLRAVIRKIAEALKPGGLFVTAHAHLLVDDPESPGFDWNEAFGAQRIGDLIVESQLLNLERELRVPLYRVQAYRKPSSLTRWFGVKKPECVQLPQPTPLPPQVAKHAFLKPRRNHRAANAEGKRPVELPILLYHRVSAAGAPATAPYRVAPAAFEKQLRSLRAAGFYTVSLEVWSSVMLRRGSLPGRPCHISFDDGYLDFMTEAWPLLKQFGYSASVFLVSEFVGRTNRWDDRFADPQPLLSWDQVRALEKEGVEFGAHTASHQPLTGLSPEEAAGEMLQSRVVLERELGHPVTAMAYPYGDWDAGARHLAGACGYTCGLTCEGGFATFHHHLLSLPRVDISGTDDLNQFAAKLNLRGRS